MTAFKVLWFTGVCGRCANGGGAMFKTIFMIGLFALAGLFVLKLAFGLFGALFGMLLLLLGLAV